MMTRQFWRLLLGIVAGMMLLGACDRLGITPQSTKEQPGTQPDIALTSVNPTRTPLAPPISPEFPTGRFAHRHANGQYCVYQFEVDGTWKFFWYVPTTDVEDVTPYAIGTYTTSHSTYTETSSNMEECPFPGEFYWTYDGYDLIFQAIGEDPCPDRQQTYEKLPYTRVE